MFNCSLLPATNTAAWSGALWHSSYPFSVICESGPKFKVLCVTKCLFFFSNLASKVCDLTKLIQEEHQTVKPKVAKLWNSVTGCSGTHKHLFPVRLHREKSSCKTVDFFMAFQPPVKLLFLISELCPFALTAFIKPRRATLLNYLTPIQVWRC